MIDVDLLGFTPTKREIQDTDRAARKFLDSIMLAWSLRRDEFANCTCSPEFALTHAEDGFHWLIGVGHREECPCY